MKLFLKIAISTALIVYILAVRVQAPDRILSLLGSIRRGPLLIAFSLHLSGLYLSGVRWKMLLEVQGIQARVWPLILSYLVGGFFNLFLPTQVGGDVIRGLDTRSRGHSVARPFGVIVVERITGMFTLLLLAVVALVSGFSFPDKARVTWVVGLMLGGMMLAVGALFFPPFLRLLRGTGLLGRLGKAGALVSEFHKSLTIYASHPREFGKALTVGLLLQLNYILHFYFVGEALNLGLPLAFYFVNVPVMCVVLLLPVTFSGVGLRESGNVVFFGLMGKSAADAVAFSLLGFSMTVLFGIIGGIVYAVRTAPPVESGPANPRLGQGGSSSAIDVGTQWRPTDGAPESPTVSPSPREGATAGRRGGQ